MNQETPAPNNDRLARRTHLAFCLASVFLVALIVLVGSLYAMS
jgi:hypothetical protein